MSEKIYNFASKKNDQTIELDLFDKEKIRKGCRVLSCDGYDKMREHRLWFMNEYISIVSKDFDLIYGIGYNDSKDIDILQKWIGEDCVKRTYIDEMSTLIDFQQRTNGLKRALTIIDHANGDYVTSQECKKSLESSMELNMVTLHLNRGTVVYSGNQHLCFDFVVFQKQNTDDHSDVLKKQFFPKWKEENIKNLFASIKPTQLLVLDRTIITSDPFANLFIWELDTTIVPKKIESKIITPHVVENQDNDYHVFKVLKSSIPKNWGVSITLTPPKQ